MKRRCSGFEVKSKSFVLLPLIAYKPCVYGSFVKSLLTELHKNP
ncbi:MAG: hypothetical protein RR806_05535 [Oscillospiraceae bacterium]